MGLSRIPAAACMVIWILSSCADSPVGQTDAQHAEADAPDSSRTFSFEAGIRGIFEDRHGNFWISSPDGSCMMSRECGDPVRLPDDVGKNPSTGGGFQEDANGNLWAQSENGIFRYQDFEFKPLETRDFSNTDDWNVEEEDLWFGTDGGVSLTEAEGRYGVYRLRGDTCTYLTFPDTVPGEGNHFYPLTSKVMKGKDGTLWFGTFEAAFGFKDGEWDVIGRKRMGRTTDDSDIGIRGYHLDSRGLLWMADNGKGVYVYDGDSVYHFTGIHNLREEDTEGHSLHRSFAIGEDSSGNIWIGTIYSGIWRYTPSSDDPIHQGTFTHFSEEEGYPCEYIWTFYLSPSGKLLLTCDDPSGVYWFNNEGFVPFF